MEQSIQLLRIYVKESLQQELGQTKVKGLLVRLERNDGKLSRTVQRGGERSDSRFSFPT